MLKVLKYLFVGLFLLEVLVKWVGLGIRKYFKDDWNKFDCTIAFLGLFITIYVTNVILGDVKSLKMFKVAKMCTLLKALSSLRTFEMFSIMQLTWNPVLKLKKMTNNILVSVPMMCEMLMLVGVVMYWYGLVGTSEFNQHTHP